MINIFSYHEHVLWNNQRNPRRKSGPLRQPEPQLQSLLLVPLPHRPHARIVRQRVPRLDAQRSPSLPVRFSNHLNHLKRFESRQKL